MKKIVLLLFIIFLTTGCSVNYTVIINNNDFTEDVKIYAYEDENYKLEDLYYSYLEEYPIYIDEEFMYYDPYNKIEGNTYYTKTYKELQMGYLFNYKSNINYENINRARTLKTFFKNGKIGHISEEDYYYISLNNTNLFTNNNIEKLTVNLVFEGYEVISHNAKSINNNTYTWEFINNEEAKIDIKYRKKKESIEIDENDIIDNKNDKNVNNNSFLDYILLGAILLLFMIGIIGLIKYKSINKEG